MFVWYFPVKIRRYFATLRKLNQRSQKSAAIRVILGIRKILLLLPMSIIREFCTNNYPWIEYQMYWIAPGKSILFQWLNNAVVCLSVSNVKIRHKEIYFIWLRWQVKGVVDDVWVALLLQILVTKNNVLNFIVSFLPPAIVSDSWKKRSGSTLLALNSKATPLWQVHFSLFSSRYNSFFI